MKRKPSVVSVQRPEAGGRRFPTPNSSLLTPHFPWRSTFSVRRFLPVLLSSLFPLPYRTSSRRGATLLVTLGVLTVLSVMVVTFLLSARYHSQSAKHFSDKIAAQQALSFTLVEAMQSIDDAMVASNYVANSTSLSDTEKNKRRVYPLKLWRAINDTGTFSQRPNQNSDAFLFPVPNSTSANTNNLLTSEVGRFLPAALTNWISPNNLNLRLCGGWTNYTAETRVSYALFNCSGFIDAHCYAETNALIVTTQHVSRTYFSQQDLLRDKNKEVVQNFVTDSAKAESNPFFISSYDPNPNAMPLEKDSVQVSENFGSRDFNPVQKFDLNSITNHFLSLSGMGVKKRLAVMPASWFNNVTRLLQSASISNLQETASFGGRDAYFGEAKKVAWNIVNYMTESRIPTAFSDNVLDSSSNKASRLDYAIEAVPLINEVELKTIFSGTKNDYEDNIDNDLYGNALYLIDQKIRAPFLNVPSGENPPTVNIEWSNIYTFDVELWYPFKPLPVPKKAYLWLSVTTNSPSAFAATQFPSGWLNDDSYNTLGYTLFYRWNELFASTNANTTVTNDVAWNVIQTNAVLLTYVKNPSAFNSVSNQTEVADAFSSLWQLTWLAGIQTETNYPINTYTYQLLNTTLPYTNRITQAVLTNSLAGVTAVLNSPYSGIDWDDATAVAQYFKELFKTSASQFSEYEKQEIQPEWFTENQEYHVFHCTNTLAYFPYVVTNYAANGTDMDSITIRFSALAGEGKKNEGQTAEECATWLRPMVTVSEIDLPVLDTVDGIPEVVDEALLIRNGSKAAGYYKRWDKPGSISFSDPRDNAWYDPNQTENKGWKEYAEGIDTMGGGNGAINENCTVAEYPFIHYDRPFLSIGELGYINVDLTNRFDDVYNRVPHPSGQNIKRDTIDFSTRSGASLLDKFCIGGVSNVTRGLVQANTTQGEVIRRVFNQTQLGWPKLWTTDYQEQGYNSKVLTLDDDDDTDTWVDHWTNTLFKAYGTPSPDSDYSGLPGWTCFAEMLPDLSTNALAHGMVQIPVLGDLNADTHDYIEDVMRGIIDKVSFRQNIYVVVIAAQTLSPASTDEHPIVLADQRAAVTVIRDAFTGRWMIANWTWLTE